MSVDSAAYPESTHEVEVSAPALVPADVARREAMTLLASVFVIAAFGLAYELLIATVSSYLLGSSVTQFSVSIGIFIGAMGIGSHLSQRFTRNLLGSFILIELLIGLVGGVSVILLFWSYAAGIAYWFVLYGMLIAIGAMTGLELPLLTRILRRYGSLRTTIAQALSFDYVGALVGSLAFPLLLLPWLGLARTAFVIGLLNIAVAAWNISVFRPRLQRPAALLGGTVVVAAVLGFGFLFSVRIVSLAESHLYEDEIVYSAQTPYQRIVMTRWKDDLRLFIDGNLQFSSTDEYRYHEALIHPAMSLAPTVERALILGGGDGLAVRELLKYSGIREIILVDIDPKMTDLAKTYPAIRALNHESMNDPRVKIVNQDAHKFLERDSALYDVIVIDLPDPNNELIAKLYSVEFYRLVKKRLSAQGVLVTQATSPFFSRDAFWCINDTLSDSGLQVLPYHTYVPSFGDWGFIIASNHKLNPVSVSVRAHTRYLTPELVRQMFLFGKDSGPVPVDSSTLDRPVVLNYYLSDSRQWE